MLLESYLSKVAIVCFVCVAQERRWETTVEEDQTFHHYRRSEPPTTTVDLCLASPPFVFALCRSKHYKLKREWEKMLIGAPPSFAIDLGRCCSRVTNKNADDGGGGHNNGGGGGGRWR